MSVSVVLTDELHGRLTERTAERSRHIDRQVETLTSRDDGAVVEFTDGIREWFDLVLYADSPDTAAQLCKEEATDTSPLTQYEIAFSGKKFTYGEPQYLDIWDPEAYVQSVPRQRSERLIRITAPQRMVTGSIAERITDQLHAETTAMLDTKLTETASSTVRQTVLADRHIDTSLWGSGRVGYCGQAVCEFVPASGFSPAFGIEDALAFVTELVRNNGPGADVVTAYADQRAQRLGRLLWTARLARPDHVELSSVPSNSPLETVGLLRSVSLAPTFGGTLLSVQQMGFGYR